jgi:hypothetical protein
MNNIIEQITGSSESASLPASDSDRYKALATEPDDGRSRHDHEKTKLRTEIAKLTSATADGEDNAE